MGRSGCPNRGNKPGVRPLIAALATVLLWGGGAAADEKEWILAFQPGASMIHVADRDAWGGAFALDLSYGVTDAIAVRATGAYSAHSLPDLRNKMGDLLMPGGFTSAWNAGLGVTYTIDILRLVPYVDFAVGLIGARYPTDKGDVTRNELGLEIGIGLDYLVSRRVAVGVIVRYHAFLTAISQLPVYLYFGPRLALHFGG
jgi:outer membrane protein W